MQATYISATSFKVYGSNKTPEFVEGRRLKLDCASDGVMYATVASSSYSSLYTTVVIDEECLTENLVTVYYSVLLPGDEGNVSEHDHSEDEGEGGGISFLSLADVYIDTYSMGQFLMVTSSGIEAVDNPILTAPDSSTWALKVTNSGTLYTEEV